MNSVTCEYPFLNSNNSCTHQPLNGDEKNYCIFHSTRDDKDKDGTFWGQIQQKLKNKDFDFEGYYFPLGLKADFSGIQFTDANFCQTIFRDLADFQGAQFKGKGLTNFFKAQFIGEGEPLKRWSLLRWWSPSTLNRKGELPKNCDDLSATLFTGKISADFRKATFFAEGGTSFFMVTFGGQGCTDFSDARFLGKGNHDFSLAEFSGKAGTYFRATRFNGEGKADFMGVIFSSMGNTCFSNAEFSQKEGVVFSMANFSGKGDVDFSRAGFSCSSDFSGADFSKKDNTLFINTAFGKECKFTFVKFPRNSNQCVVFRGTREPIDLSKCMFLYCNPERLVFHNFKFCENEPDELFGFKFPLWKRGVVIPDEKSAGKDITIIYKQLGDDKNKGPSEQIIKERVRVEFLHIEEIYRQFKKNLEAEKNWEKAGEFHYGEMECKRKALVAPEDWPTCVGPLRQNLGLLAWYKYFSGYGERPCRALSWLVLFVFVSAGMYYLLDTAPKQSFLEYYLWNVSIKATFLQRIGEAGTEPPGLGKAFYLFQSIICPTLLALLILALRRKVKR